MILLRTIQNSSHSICPRNRKSFVDWVRKQAESYKTKNIMLTIGGDFTHANANRWFQSFDKLIDFVNKNRSDIKIFYSTVFCCLKSIHENPFAVWPTKSDDFFSYASPGPHCYWTGYFTSRATFKGFARDLSALLQICKQIAAFGNLPSGSLDTLSKLQKSF